MRGTRRWWARGAITAVAAAVIIGFTLVEQSTPLVVPIVLLVGAVVAIAGMVVDTGGAESPDWHVPAGFAGSTSAGQDAGLAGLVRLLESHLSSRQVDPLLRDRLARLTEDRLDALGLTRDDPEVVAMLGPTLLGILHGPPRTLRPDEIDECIRRIEELSHDREPH